MYENYTYKDLGRYYQAVWGAWNLSYAGEYDNNESVWGLERCSWSDNWRIVDAMPKGKLLTDDYEGIESDFVGTLFECMKHIHEVYGNADFCPDVNDLDDSFWEEATELNGLDPETLKETFLNSNIPLADLLA